MSPPADGSSGSTGDRAATTWSERYAASSERFGDATTQRAPRWVLRTSLLMLYVVYIVPVVLFAGGVVLALVRHRWLGALLAVAGLVWAVVRGWMGIRGRWMPTEAGGVPGLRRQLSRPRDDGQ